VNVLLVLILNGKTNVIVLKKTASKAANVCLVPKKSLVNVFVKNLDKDLPNKDVELIILKNVVLNQWVGTSKILMPVLSFKTVLKVINSSKVVKIV